MSGYEIVPCRLSHLRRLAHTLRPEDRAEFLMAGLEPRHRLHELYRMTAEPKAALVEGEVACAWGDAAAYLAGEGLMWLVTSPAIERLLPLSFFRATRHELDLALRHRRVLRACIAGPYQRAIRFFSMLGFEIEEPQIIGGNEFRIIRLYRG